MDTKQCVKCGEVKPVDMFYANKHSRDKKCYRCKVCMNIVTMANFKKKQKPKKDWSTDEGFKICRKCLNKKPISEFNIHYGKTRTKDKLRHECKECQKKHSREHWVKIAVREKEKKKLYNISHRHIAHNAHLRSKYNISLEDYQSALKQQNGKCAICGSDKPKGRYRNFAVDHDHSTGDIRGLLCAPCNTGMGHFQDSPELLRKAADYLESHNHLTSI